MQSSQSIYFEVINSNYMLLPETSRVSIKFNFSELSLFCSHINLFNNYL